jgi:hypothetical protein
MRVRKSPSSKIPRAGLWEELWFTNQLWRLCSQCSGRIKTQLTKVIPLRPLSNGQLHQE